MFALFLFNKKKSLFSFNHAKYYTDDVKEHYEVAMFNARNSGFYTGSFSTEYIVPNTPYLHKGDLIAATDYYCSQQNFNADKCSSLARQLGERIGVLETKPVLQTKPANKSPAVSSAAAVAAANFAVAGLKGVKNEFDVKRR